MAITITVEDGTGVADANSYQDVATVTTYALNRGVVLSTTSDVVAAQLINAMDYLAKYRARWKGQAVYPGRYTAWPRKNVQIDGEDFADDEIPSNLIEAQAQLVMVQSTGIVLAPNTGAELPVIMEKVGPLETRYASPADMAGSDWEAGTFPIVDALLEPLLAQVGGLRTLRI